MKLIKLNKIYFDGKSYAQALSNNKDLHSQEEIDLANSFNFTPVDSISFEDYQTQTYCDIKIGNHIIQAVSLDHLYTNIEKKNITTIYPSHNSTPDPGGLY